jgi:hypothetical protein
VQGKGRKLDETHGRADIGLLLVFLWREADSRLQDLTFSRRILKLHAILNFTYHKYSIKKRSEANECKNQRLLQTAPIHPRCLQLSPCP